MYAWRVDGGAIEPDDVQMVVWTAPETAGVAWIHVDVTREDGAKAGQSAYVRVEVPEPEPEPVPALPLLGQLLLALGLAGAGADEARAVRAAPVRVAWRLTGCGGRHGHLGPPAGDGAEVPEDIPAAAFTLARARALLDEVRNPGAWCPIIRRCAGIAPGSHPCGQGPCG